MPYNRSRPLSSKPFPILVIIYITYATGYLDVQIKEDEVSKEHSTDGRDENAYSVLARISDGKISLGRPRIRRVNDFKMEPKETGLENVARDHLTQNRDLWRALVSPVVSLGSF
jgi:hypothetical protein